MMRKYISTETGGAVKERAITTETKLTSERLNPRYAFKTDPLMQK